MNGVEEVIQQAIEEWATIQGGPQSYTAGQPTLAHYIATKLRSPYVNHVIMGDGTRAVLVPGGGCTNRITEPDGHISCNHGDSTPCDRTGHDTISLWEVVSYAKFYEGADSESALSDANADIDSRRLGAGDLPDQDVST